VVALIVIGPERLPKVARTAGHLYGRLQRYVSTVRSDISREMQLDEMRRAGQSFKESVEAAASDVQQQATVVDDYLRNELAGVDKSASENARPAEPAAKPPETTPPSPQRSLPLDEPDQNPRALTEAASSREKPHEHG
jgi:sec-independent protein translocase protein TatB